MPLFGNRIDQLIDQLENTIPHVEEGFTFFQTERSDWRPVWALCRQIQSEFKGFQGFKTRDEHQAAWERFQTIRQRASRLADIEKERFAAQSLSLKDEILDEAKSAYWSMSGDFFVGTILGETDLAELQELQSILKGAGQKLSQNKHLMTKSDKEQCFEKIKEVRESHDRCYEKLKEMKNARREASRRKSEEFERKREAWRERTQANIAKNNDKLDRARGALERTRDRISEIEGKLYETDSDKWRGIFSEWLSEAQSKESDIEESIARIESWISEDQSKLDQSY